MTGGAGGGVVGWSQILFFGKFKMFEISFVAVPASLNSTLHVGEGHDCNIFCSTNRSEINHDQPRTGNTN